MTSTIPKRFNGFFLVTCSGRQARFQRSAENDVLTVGRNGKQPNKNRFACNHTTVSREHAQIETSVNGDFVLIDLGSKYGTRVNSKRLAKGEKYILKDGDRIQLGLAQAIIFRNPRQCLVLTMFDLAASAIHQLRPLQKDLKILGLF